MRKLLLAAAAFASCMSGAWAAEKPDIIVMLVDDSGASVIGPVARSVPSPAIDALANAGVNYRTAYAQPACIPARAQLLMGGDPQRTRNGGVDRPNGPWPSGSAVTIAERLKAAGYETHLVGKWHLGWSGAQHPLGQGFDTFFGFKGITPDYVGDDPRAPLYRDHTRIKNTGYVTDTLAAEAVRVLKAPHGKPLFLYLAWTAIHAPLQTTLAASVARMDAAVARVRAAAKPGTLIILAGDNGRAVNAGLRGGKFSAYEGGVRVHFSAAWVGRDGPLAPPTAPVSLEDIAPTALDAAGLPIPAAMDGVSLLRPVPADRALMWATPGSLVIRQGPWKLHLYGQRAELYNLTSDLAERRNVASANQEVVRTLSAKVRAWKASW